MTFEKKKVLFVITYGGWGGAQRYVFDLATNLDPNRFNVEVAAGREDAGELVDRLAGAGIKTHLLRHLKRGLSPIANGLSLFELARIIKKSSPDIVHLNSTNAGIIGSLAAYLYKLNTKDQKLKTIFTAHGFRFNEPGAVKKIVFIALEKSASRFRDHIICVSEADRASSIKNKIAPVEKLTVIRNAIADFKPLPRDSARAELFPDLPKEELLVGTIAQHYPAKGLSYLVEAAALLKKENAFPKMRFAIIGDGPEKENLGSRIKNHGLTNNFFLLPYRKNGAKYISAFDIVVSPSLKEGLPYLLLEASLAGCAIAATSVGGVPEIIRDGQTGLLLEPANPQAMARAILKLTESAETRKTLGENARAFASKKFRFNEMLRGTEEIYENLLLSS